MVYLFLQDVLQFLQVIMLLLEIGSSRQYLLLKDRRHWGQVLILKGKVTESFTS